MSMIIPKTVPTEPRNMHSDYQNTGLPPVSALYFFHTQLDIARMKEALHRVVSNNPELAGRFRSKPFGQLSFAGTVGVPFHVIQLSDEQQQRLERLSAQQVAAEPMQTLDFWGEVGFVFSKSGGLCKDNDGNANCTVTVAQGSSLAVVTLSISHATVDGKAYYDILRAWDSEFDAPGSTRPMAARQDLSKKIVDPFPSFFFGCATLFTCILPFIRRFCLAKTRTKIDSVAIYMATDKQYKAMKDAALETSNSKKLAKEYGVTTQPLVEDDTMHISGNDAHLAFLGNTIKAKVVTQTMDARGPGPRIKGDPIPQDYLGNAFFLVGASSRAGGDFDAMCFRKAVSLHDSGTEGVSLCTHGRIDFHQTVFASSWAKIQHWPKFGTRTGCFLQLPHYGDLIVWCTTSNYHVRTSDDSYLFCHIALTPEQAQSFKKACDDLGLTCTILSAAEVTKYWRSDPTRIHS